MSESVITNQGCMAACHQQYGPTPVPFENDTPMGQHLSDYAQRILKRENGDRAYELGKLRDAWSQLESLPGHTYTVGRTAVKAGVLATVASLLASPLAGLLVGWYAGPYKVKEAVAECDAAHQQRCKAICKMIIEFGQSRLWRLEELIPKINRHIDSNETKKKEIESTCASPGILGPLTDWIYPPAACDPTWQKLNREVGELQTFVTLFEGERTNYLDRFSTINACSQTWSMEGHKFGVVWQENATFRLDIIA